MEIQITTKKSEGLERLLEVSVPVETVRDAEDKAARKYATQARLPGFRPGKAPAAIVRKKFGEAIRQAALETLVQDAFKEVMEREKLQPASQPHVHDLHFHEGKPLTFELHVEVRPEVKLDRTSGFRVKRPEQQVGDAQLQEQLDALRDQRATWAPVEEKPMPGDQVTVNLATAEEGGAMSEGKEYRLVIGEGQAIPAIEELILEAKPGQTIERPVKWPDDFPDEAQRGKTKPVRVQLLDVKRKSLPALDDAFARDVGDFDSLDALKAAVKSDLESHAQRDAESQLRQQLLDEVISANPFDVPEGWVSELSDAYLKQFQVPEEERPRFAQEFRPVAERQVRRDLVIEAIAEREGLTATEADIDDRVAEVASKRGSNPSEVYASLQKAGRLREIERSITEEKVFTWLKERNTVE
ncbi:MAG TPA: trigger factor [Gemmatimonadaceae bacterium]|nr:trigger factor [Gemmatimonadaceae bacterium]